MAAAGRFSSRSKKERPPGGGRSLQLQQLCYLQAPGRYLVPMVPVLQPQVLPPSAVVMMSVEPAMFLFAEPAPRMVAVRVMPNCVRPPPAVIETMLVYLPVWLPMTLAAVL